jgi:flagellar biosynthesis/type III secretory pathway protein FliH
MGFFKNIGKSIKKATKQISFKNVVKIASSLDPTGIAGGIVGSIEAKKEEKKALQQQEQAQREYDAAVLAQNKAEAETQAQNMEIARKNAEYQRMLVASNTQAVGGKVGLVAGSVVGQIGVSAVNAGMQQINSDFQTGVAKAGANLANNTMNEWLKMHWWKVALAVISLLTAIYFVSKKRK